MSATYLPMVENMVRAMVSHPDVVTVEEEYRDGARTFFVRVADDDIGKVIGKSGRVVAALRCVVSAVASKSREKAYVKVVTE